MHQHAGDLLVSRIGQPWVAGQPGSSCDELQHAVDFSQNVQISDSPFRISPAARAMWNGASDSPSHSSPRYEEREPPSPLTLRNVVDVDNGSDAMPRNVINVDTESDDGSRDGTNSVRIVSSSLHDRIAMHGVLAEQEDQVRHGSDEVPAGVHTGVREAAVSADFEVSADSLPAASTPGDTSASDASLEHANLEGGTSDPLSPIIQGRRPSLRAAAMVAGPSDGCRTCGDIFCRLASRSEHGMSRRDSIISEDADDDLKSQIETLVTDLESQIETAQGPQQPAPLSTSDFIAVVDPQFCTFYFSRESSRFLRNFKFVKQLLNC